VEVGRDKLGRVHLAIHREGQRETIGLDAPLFERQWQDQVAVSAANTARGVLREQPTVETVLQLTRATMTSLSRLIAGLLALAPRGASVACKAGCAHCCHVVVAVTPPEALAIFDQVQRALSGPALAEQTKRNAEQVKRVPGQ
jgi:hypothetical protein